MNPRSNRKDNKAASRRRLRGILLSLVGLLVCWLLLISANVLFPAQERSEPGVDAVASLAPQFDRLPTALRLFEQADPNVLMISYFPHDSYMEEAGIAGEGAAPFASYCDDTAGDRIVCFTPEEESTLGEALAIRDMAETASWESLTVVTSKYHAFRTRLIFNRCLGSDVDVSVIYADTDLSTSQWLWHVAYENAAYAKALIETTFRC